MLALPIAEHQDVTEDIHPCRLPVRIDTVLDPLTLG
jgi:hypothetical protein